MIIFDFKIFIYTIKRKSYEKKNRKKENNILNIIRS